MKTHKKGYPLILGLTVILTLAAIATLIPQASASKPCLLGYHAHCTFTPVSTLICVLIAGLLCGIRKKQFTEET